MKNAQSKFQKNTLQVKETITSKCLWPVVYSKYPDIAEAVATPGKHITCPFHGGNNDFRFYKDAFTSNPEFKSVAAICTCGKFSHYELVCKLEGRSVNDIEITRMLADVAVGYTDAQPVQPTRKKQAGSTYPKKAWEQSRPIRGAGLVYLGRRGLSACLEQMPESIRYLPDSQWNNYQGPCLIGRCSYPDNELAGIIRIFLSPDGDKANIEKPKPMLGYANGRSTPLSGSAVRMPGEGNIEHVGEGIETVLPVKFLFPETVNACGTAALLGNFGPMPESTGVIIWADLDRTGTGEKAAKKLIDLLKTKGIPAIMLLPEAEIPKNKKGVDWLDIFNQSNGSEIMKTAYTKAREQLSVLAEQTQQESLKRTEQTNDNNPLSNMDAFRLVMELEQKKTADLPKKGEVISLIRNALNNDFCMAYMGSKPVLIEQYTRTDDRPFKATAIASNGYYDFLKSVPYQGYKTAEDGKIPVKKTVNIFREWLQWTQANRKGVVVFDPTPNASQKDYNLWTGYKAAQLEIVQNSDYLDTWKEYLYNALAPGENLAAEYIENWLAHLIQFPWFKPGVAVAAQSKGKGTGKSILGELVRNMIGRHYIRIFAKHQIIGQFTGHLADKNFASVEESCLAGDPVTDGAIKNLITSETQVVENKGKDAHEVDSFLRLYFTSNNEYFVNASEDERRWLIINNDKSQYRQNTEFFGKLAMSNNKTGKIYSEKVSTLFNYLLNKDLSGFDVRKVPETEAMRIQKELSASPMESFYKYLISGDFESERMGGVLSLEQAFHREVHGELWIRKDIFKEEFEFYQKSWHPNKRQYVAPNNIKRYLDSICKGFFRDKKARDIDKPASFDKRYWIFSTDY